MGRIFFLFTYRVKGECVLVTTRAVRTQCILRGNRASPALTGVMEKLLAVLGAVGCAGQWRSEQGVKFQEDQAARTKRQKNEIACSWAGWAGKWEPMPVTGLVVREEARAKISLANLPLQKEPKKGAGNGGVTHKGFGS